MKPTIFLLTISLLAFLCCCSDEQPYVPENKSISIWEGEASHISIETELTHCDYTLLSEDPQIATAIFDEMGINIITYKSGKTMIRLMDNDKILCKIHVYVKYFNSPEIVDWGIPLKDYPNCPGVIIKAAELKILPQIEKELREESEPFIGATYTFDRDTRIFTMKNISEVYYEGTYQWDLTSLTLTCNGKTTKYGFGFARGITRDGYVIQADKTQEYQQRYPDAGITEVKVNHIWKDHGIIYLGGLILD